MLHEIRERIQGWIAWIIISVIIFIFAVWGIQNFFTPDPNLPVIEVDDTEVGLREIQSAYQQQRDRINSLGTGLDLPEERVKQQVINDLIERIVLTNTAHKLGMRFGDQLLAAQINSIDAFRVNGNFSRDRYEQLLRNQGLTPLTFEQRTRSTLISQQLYAGIVNTTLLTPSQINDHLRLDGQTRDLAYLTIPADRFLDKITITPEELQHYYQEHTDAYQIPEQVTIAYLELSATSLESNIPVPEEELQKLFAETSANYHRTERRRANHILLTLAENADDATVSAARSKLEDLRKKIDSGESFTELARTNSQDPGSAPQGGDLGFFERGAMVKPFEDATFALVKEGEISAPIRTQFGLHLIQLTGIEPEHSLTFTEAHDNLVQEYRRIQAEKQFFERVETLANLAYEHPDTLDPAATQLNLKIQTLGPFSRTAGKDLAREPKILDAAFSDDVLTRGNNSDPIELADKRVVVLRVTEHQPARRQTLDEVRDPITSAFRNQKAHAQAKNIGEDLLRELRAGKDFNTVAESVQLTWKTLGWIGRKIEELPSELVTATFRLPHPEKNAPVYEGLVLSNGDFSIIQLKDVKDGDPNSATPETRAEIRRQLTTELGEQEFISLITDLKAKAKIVIHRERL